MPSTYNLSTSPRSSTITSLSSLRDRARLQTDIYSGRGRVVWVFPGRHRRPLRVAIDARWPGPLLDRQAHGDHRQDRSRGQGFLGIENKDGWARQGCCPPAWRVARIKYSRGILHSATLKVKNRQARNDPRA